jgi:hypothetical protein
VTELERGDVDAACRQSIPLLRGKRSASDLALITTDATLARTQ